MASEKVTALVEQVKELTVLELSELVHTLEEVFGVSAAAAAVAAAACSSADIACVCIKRTYCVTVLVDNIDLIDGLIIFPLLSAVVTGICTVAVVLNIR